MYAIIITQSVMLSLCTEVIQMKYENPTCEIVLLERADCFNSNENVKTEDSPWINLPTF